MRAMTTIWPCKAGRASNLSKYAGKRVKRYTYEITNYPTGETGILANLLIYKNTVIRGRGPLSPAGRLSPRLAMP